MRLDRTQSDPDESLWADLATAPTLAPQPRELAFFTFDARQREVVHTIGFRI